MHIEKSILRSILSAFLLCIHINAHACSSCRATVKAAIYNENFFIHFFMLMAPLLILGLLVWLCIRSEIDDCYES